MSREILVVGIVLLSVGSVASLAGRGTEPPRRELLAEDIRQPTAAEKRLTALCWEIKRSWEPRQRAELVASAQEHTLELAPAFPWLLTDPEGEIVGEAIELAAELGLVELRPQILVLMESLAPELRPAAVAAAEKLGPWTPQELYAFLSCGKLPVVVAALEISKTRADAPVEAILPLLEHDSVLVREAALDALPAELADEDTDYLVALATSGASLSARYALRALGRTRLSAETARVVAAQLGNPDPAMRDAACRALERRGEPLDRETLDILVDLFDSDDADLAAKAHLLRLAERCESVPADAIRESFDSWPPLLRYFGARCLVAAGDRGGLARLIDLAEGDPRGSDPKVARAAELLLRELAGGADLHGAEDWLLWLDKLTVLPGLPLPKPALDV